MPVAWNNKRQAFVLPPGTHADRTLAADAEQRAIRMIAIARGRQGAKTIESVPASLPEECRNKHFFDRK